MNNDKKKTKFENALSTGLEIVETGLTIAGAFVPLIGAIGGGIGLFNKVYAKKNFEYFTKKLESIELKLIALTEEQERNFTFRIIDITNKIIKSRTLEKIDSFVNVIKYGITTGSILQSNEDIDQIVDLIDKLNLEDIEFLENFYKLTHKNLSNGHDFFGSLENDSFQNLHFLNKEKSEPINMSGFKENSIILLQKCIGYGLIVQKFDLSKIIKTTNEKISIPNSTFNLQNPGFEYTLSPIYIKLRAYLKTSNKNI